MTNKGKEFIVYDVRNGDEIIMMGTMSEIAKRLGVSIPCVCHCQTLGTRKR